MRLVLGGDRRLRTGAEQLAHAADVDHDVVPELDRPVLEQRGDARQLTGSGFVRRVDQENTLPPRRRYRFSMSISGAKKSVFGPATTSTDASAGTSFCCASTSLSTV